MDLDGLFLKALDARQGSYSPYSKFRVGCAILTKEGSVITGANIENASYGAAICAERTAIVQAVSSGHRRFEVIAVTTDLDYACSPCGICRQVLREFCAPETSIYLVPSTYKAGSSQILRLTEYLKLDAQDRAGRVVKTSMSEILPISFGPEDLGK